MGVPLFLLLSNEKKVQISKKTHIMHITGKEGKNMDNSVFVRTVPINCPICGTTHAVAERRQSTTTVIQDDQVTYEERFYVCLKAQHEDGQFTTRDLINKNLSNANDAYRIKHGLLTSDEIAAIREKYCLKPKELDKLLGWKRGTVSRYESEKIQDEDRNEQLLFIRDNPAQVLKYLKKEAIKSAACIILAVITTTVVFVLGQTHILEPQFTSVIVAFWMIWFACRA